MHGLPVETLDREFHFQRVIYLHNVHVLEDHFPLERHAQEKLYFTRSLAKKALVGTEVIKATPVSMANIEKTMTEFEGLMSYESVVRFLESMEGPIEAIWLD